MSAGPVIIFDRDVVLAAIIRGDVLQQQTRHALTGRDTGALVVFEFSTLKRQKTCLNNFLLHEMRKQINNNLDSPPNPCLIAAQRK